MALGIGLLLILGIARSVLPRPNANVQVVFSHFENTRGNDIGVFQVSNTGKVPVTFYGYSPTALVNVVARELGSNWHYYRFTNTDYSLVRPVTLAPGDEMPVYIGVPTSGRWMVGFEYSSAPVAAELPRFVWRYLSQLDLVRNQLSIAWSGPLTRSSKPTNIVPPLQTGSGQ